MQNGDIRSKVRQAGFPDAVKKLKALGVAAEIVEGNVPEGKNDVQGAMLGVADFDWKASQSTILPGTICEHFTSFGGDMHAGAGQTPLSELLRYGAAAASGTVTEPYAIAQQVPRAHDASALRPRVHGRRVVLPGRALPLSTADRGRSALPSLGEHP